MSVIIGILLVPMTINYVDATKYGIWLIISSIVGWFNLFDIGFGNGLKNKLAQTNALKQYDDSRIFISSTYAILAVISCVIFLSFFIASQFLNWNKILNIPINSISNLKELIIILFGIFCIQFVSQILNVILTAVHATSKVSILSFISQVLCLILIYLFTKFTHGSLFYLVIAFGGIPILIQIISSIWYFNSSYKYLAPNFNLIDFKKAKSLLSIGGYFFLIQIGALILFETDNIVITQIFGPKEVTTFNISYKLFSIVINIFTIVMTPFWSAFTDAYTKNDFGWIKSIFKKMYLYWMILGLICLFLTSISTFVYKLWLENKVQVPISLSISMGLYVVGFCWLMIHCYLLNGIGKIKLQLYLYIISMLINIPLAIFLGKTIGIAGVTLSNVFVFLYMDVILYIQCKKILNQKAVGIWNQ